MVVRGSTWEAASCTSRSGTPASSAAVMNECRGVVSLSLAGPGSDHVRRDDTAEAWVLAGVAAPGTARWCYPQGPKKRTFWAIRGVGRLRTSPPRAGRRRDEFWLLRSG